jgi:hypothetical protein
MPYDKEGKLKAKEYVNNIRSKTVCEKCKGQPIEWHHVDHEADGNQRVAHLVSLGFPIERIQREIDKCEALCRLCHMKHDGRLEQLRNNAPRKKGMVYVEPQQCITCNTLSKKTWKKMCRRCYDYQRRH